MSFLESLGPSPRLELARANTTPSPTLPLEGGGQACPVLDTGVGVGRINEVFQ